MPDSHAVDPGLIAGGFVLTRKVPRSEFSSAELLPPTILSLSACIAQFLPPDPIWPPGSVTDQEVEEQATYWGLAVDQVRAMDGWVARALAEGRVGYPCVCRSLGAIEGFLDWLGTPLDGAILLGFGLEPSHREDFLREESMPGSLGDIGVVGAIRDGTNLPVEGRLLGWEILGIDGVSFHSWLCSMLEVDVEKQLGIRPNDLGLIEDAAQANAIADWIDEHDRGEPVDYWPWAIVEYPLAGSRTG